MLLLVKDVAASGVGDSKDFQLPENGLRKTYIWQGDRGKRYFFGHHIEFIIVQKTKVPVSDISVRLSCQVSRERYFISASLFFE